MIDLTFFVIHCNVIGRKKEYPIEKEPFGFCIDVGLYFFKYSLLLATWMISLIDVNDYYQNIFFTPIGPQIKKEYPLNLSI